MVWISVEEAEGYGEQFVKVFDCLHEIVQIGNLRPLQGEAAKFRFKL